MDLEDFAAGLGILGFLMLCFGKHMWEYVLGGILIAGGISCAIADRILSSKGR